MKILSASQTRVLDAYTIEQEPISSIDLMERASSVFVNWFVERVSSNDRVIYIFCGIGNNGGDGLVIARQLFEKGYKVQVYICQISQKGSPDFETNLKRLPASAHLILTKIAKEDALPELVSGSIIIDAIFGSGLNRPLEGYWANLVERLNYTVAVLKVAVDVPSGMFTDEHTSGISFEADYTFSFELPKLAFFFRENYRRVGKWQVASIGLHPAGIAQSQTSYIYITPAIAQPLYRQRNKFDHKGVYGHALLMAGSYGMMGAAVLAARSCMRSGLGLLSVAVPQCGYAILQISLPEALVIADTKEKVLSAYPYLNPYKVVGIGCGIGKDPATRQMLIKLMENAVQPMVIDADALNIIAEEGWQSAIPRNAVLTPHPKEFERLFGAAANEFERLNLLRAKAQKLGVFIILKGAHTAVAAPDGTVYFNSTGNPGMGTAGSGDVLTGIIIGLLAQQYDTLAACITGVFLHGLAGDKAAERHGEDALIASDMIDHLSEAFLQLRKSL